MRYDPIDSSLYISNREKLKTYLQPGSVAVLFSNDPAPRSADSFHLWRQNPDLFWLTGVDQEECALLLFPDAPNNEWKEILFVRETNPHIAIWEGEKLNKSQATQVSGVKNIQWMSQLEKLLPAILYQAKNIYLNLNEHDRFASPADYSDKRWVRYFKDNYPLHHYERLAPIMHRLRSIKSKIEIELIQKACNLTKQGFEYLLNFVKPGVWEYEIEAELTYLFLKNRSKGHSYEPIIASGANSNVLHYVDNSKQCKDGDLLLLDFGAEYANYASDLSRTIPVNGKYTPRQKEVYNAVLRVMREAKQLLKVGNNIKDYHEEVGHIMEKELVDLKLITTDDIKKQDQAWPAYKKYFMHGTSHFLGIDVHDLGNKWEPMQSGMVFTCEPGIYIPEEGFGIRIENDILITENGNTDLMEDIPIEADHIEELMQKK